MRSALIFIAVGLTLATPAKADVVSDIVLLEEEWANAFRAGDFETVDRIVAPEFTLVRIEQGEAEFTPRDRWFANARRIRFDRYETRVLGSTVAGDSAVVTVEGSWTISRGDQSRTEDFVVTDTWVRRDGRWQVMFRHSSPAPGVLP